MAELPVDVRARQLRLTLASSATRAHPGETRHACGCTRPTPRAAPYRASSRSPWSTRACSRWRPSRRRAILDAFYAERGLGVQTAYSQNMAAFQLAGRGAPPRRAPRAARRQFAAAPPRRAGRTAAGAARRRAGGQAARLLPRHRLLEPRGRDRRGRERHAHRAAARLADHLAGHRARPHRRYAGGAGHARRDQHARPVAAPGHAALLHA